MLSRPSSAALLGLALQTLTAAAFPGGDHHQPPPEVTATRTITVDVVVSRTVTVVCTETKTDWTVVTNTKTDWTEITNTNTAWTEITNTITEFTAITNTNTEWTAVTNTNTETVTETETDTDTTTTTLTSTTYTLEQNPCPTTCKMSVPSVTLVYWPTDRPHTYPTTWVDPEFKYTFSSPSVYMYIPTAVGTVPANNATVGPATSAWMLPLRLHQVSTLVPGATSLTRQLNLADLATDCPRSVSDPAAIATLGPECNPILAAPHQFSSWAYPCNACGRLGLFDPPYAVPTVEGTLVPPPPAPSVTTTVAPPPPPPPPTPAPTTAPPAPVPTTPGGQPLPTGTLLVVYQVGSQGVATATVLVPGQTGTSTSVVGVATGAPGVCPGTGIMSSSQTTGRTTGTDASATTTTSPSTAAGPKVTGGAAAAWGAGAAVVAALL